jgi:hypothetical protein
MRPNAQKPDDANSAIFSMPKKSVTLSTPGWRATEGHSFTAYKRTTLVRSSFAMPATRDSTCPLGGAIAVLALPVLWKSAHFIDIFSYHCNVLSISLNES